jgi:hypothetical protein
MQCPRRGTNPQPPARQQSATTQPRYCPQKVGHSAFVYASQTIPQFHGKHPPTPSPDRKCHVTILRLVSHVQYNTHGCGITGPCIYNMGHHQVALIQSLSGLYANLWCVCPWGRAKISQVVHHTILRGMYLKSEMNTEFGLF